jgi:hypothetical protein
MDHAALSNSAIRNTSRRGTEELMTTKWKIGLAGLSAGALLGACGGDENPAPEHTITLAAVIDRTGPQASPSWAAAIELAAADANEALEAAGKSYRFSVLPGDTGGSEEQSVAAGLQLVQDGAKMVISSSTTEAVALIGQLNYNEDESANLDVPVLCGSCTSSKINDPDATEDNPSNQAAFRDPEGWVFRSIQDSGVEVPLIMNDILLQLGDNGDVNGDGVFKVAVYGSNASSSGAFAKNIKNAIKKLNEGLAEPIAFAEEVQYDRDADSATYDYGPFLNDLTDDANQDPIDPNDADVYVPDAIVGQALPAIEAGITNGWGEDLCAGGQCDVYFLRRNNFRHQAVVQGAAEHMNGFDGLSLVVAEENPSGDYLLETMPGQSGIPLQLMDAQFYDGTATLLLATMLAADNLEDPSTVTGRAIADAMTQVSNKSGTVIHAGPDGFELALETIAEGGGLDYDGASGPIDYDEPDTEAGHAGGNVRTRLTLFTVENEQFVDGDLFDCVAAEDCPRTER